LAIGAVLSDARTLPVIPAERGDDLHGLADACDLSLFVAGNQFMVMPDLLAAFQQEYPEIRQIYYQTLPPGLSLKQILAGGATFRDRVLKAVPDVYASVNRQAMDTLVTAGRVDAERVRAYLHNRIRLMVAKGNPKGISGVMDLGRDDVRVSQPDPENEDIAFHIIDMYRAVGGDELVDRIMAAKRTNGTSIFTTVHHRETPQGIVRGTVDVGPVWATEIRHARSEGLPIDAVDPGAAYDQRDRVVYYIAPLIDAPRPDAAARFCRFITGDRAQAIYRQFGFTPSGNTTG
jgi:ABC-type molybdate transport system substrate-binding protein